MENWDDIRVFLAVARAESLSGAAPGLRMDPATLGRRVARLRHEEGQCVLLDERGWCSLQREHGAAALPAESLAVPKIIESQRELWNVIRQPLGLPLFLLLGLSLSFRGPFNYADSADIAGGTAAEVSGAPRLVWEFARLAMLTAVATVAASVFLGGYLGPWLPGPVWLVLKTAAVLLALVGLSHQLARISPSRMMTLIWTVLLPLSFVHLVWAGVLAL